MNDPIFLSSPDDRRKPKPIVYATPTEIESINRSSELILFIITRLVIAAGIVITGLYLAYLTATGTPADPMARAMGMGSDGASVSFQDWLFGENGILLGNLGSTATQRPVDRVIGERAEATRELVIICMVLVLIFGTSAGLGLGRASFFSTDFFTRIFSLLFVAAPAFWVGLGLLTITAQGVSGLPFSGRCEIVAGQACPPLTQRIEYLFLPMFSLFFMTSAGFALFVRQAVVNALRKTRRAVGVSLGAAFSGAAALLGWIIGSVVLVEVVFAWPGIGRLLVQSITQRDTAVVVGIMVHFTLVIGLVYVVGMLLYAFIIAITRGRIVSGDAAHLPYTLGVFAAPPVRNRFQRALYTGIAILAVVFLAGVVAVTFSPGTLTDADPIRAQPANRLLPPASEGAPLGTDDLGRDVLARLLAGGRTSFQIAFTAAGYALVLGLGLGVLFGLLERFSGSLLGHITSLPLDTYIGVVGSLPALLVMLLYALVNESPADGIPVVAGVYSGAYIAATVRAGFRESKPQRTGRADPGLTLSNENLDVVASAVVSKMERTQFNMNFDLGMLAGRLVLAAAYGFILAFAGALVLEFSVGFLGLGVQPPDASWGNLLSNPLASLRRAPHLVIFPGVAITFTLYALYLVVARLQDALAV